MTTTRALLAAVLLFAALLPAPAFAAATKATIAIDIVQASKEPGENDPRLAKFRAQFADFAYKSFKLIGSRLVTIEESKNTKVELAAGHSLQLSFLEAQPNGRARLKLSVPGVLDTTVSLKRDGSVLVGGPALPSGNGVLFVPVTLVEMK